MNRDLFWTGMLTRLAREGAISYNELKRLPIDEFFLVYSEYENRLRDA